MSGSVVEAGMRVIRGPDWESGDADGGEGHLGTLKALLGNGLVRVLWDNGKDVTCKAGAGGKFELRILDTASVGVRHPGSQCSDCGAKDVYGMLWRCLDTKCQGQGYTLCPLCYVMDKHETKHVFERVDYNGGNGVQVKKRSVSLKIRAMGIFPGATVSRGQDWIWGDQDGGVGGTGTVLGFENVASASSRNLVRVEWTSSSITNSYRLGFEGQVDLQCVEEIAGTYYYRDHLPVVDTTSNTGGLMSVRESLRRSNSAQTEKKSPQKSTSSQGDTSPRCAATSSPRGEAANSSPNPKGGTTSSQGNSPRGGAEGGVGSGVLKPGDKVVIAIDEDKLKELQADYGGATAGMIQCIGKTGELISETAKGALQVKFKRLSYRFNPQVLVKVPVLNVGDCVRIHTDVNQAMVFNKRVGWKTAMDVTCGKVGRVVKVDEDGDVAVAFGQRVHLYAPACCIPVTGLEVDELTSSSDSGGSSSTGQQSDDQDQELHQKLMKMLAMLGQEGGKSGGGQEDDHSEMGQLFKAIARGDVEAVKAVCMADSKLLHGQHKGMTLLMVASHEGQREVIKALLDLGADINALGDHGHTALGAALEGKKESIALFLLERGASVKILNSKERSAAHVAAYNNLPDALRDIIRRGCDINAKDKFGDCALHDAIEKDNAECIDVLMETPSLDLQACNRKGFNMLQIACLRGTVHAVERIVKKDRSHIDDLMGGEFNALHIAVTNDHVECARLLLVEGNASINVKGSQGLTALHLACNEAYPRSVELLLTLGADVHVTADDGNTPLHLAVGTKSTQLRKNPSPGLEDHEHRNRVRMACMLLEKGAYIDAKNNNDAEPMQCCRPDAIRQGVKKFVTENPHAIKRKSGGHRSASGSSREEELQRAMSALLRTTSDATKRQLQEQCKQS